MASHPYTSTAVAEYFGGRWWYENKSKYVNKQIGYPALWEDLEKADKDSKLLIQKERDNQPLWVEVISGDDVWDIVNPEFKLTENEAKQLKDVARKALITRVKASLKEIDDKVKPFREWVKAVKDYEKRLQYQLSASSKGAKAKLGKVAEVYKFAGQPAKKQQQLDIDTILTLLFKLRDGKDISRDLQAFNLTMDNFRKLLLKVSDKIFERVNRWAAETQYENDWFYRMSQSQREDYFAQFTLGKRKEFFKNMDLFGASNTSDERGFFVHWLLLKGSRDEIRQFFEAPKTQVADLMRSNFNRYHVEQQIEYPVILYPLMYIQNMKGLSKGQKAVDNLLDQE